MHGRRQIERAKMPNHPSGIIIQQAKKGSPAIVHEVSADSPLFGLLAPGDVVVELAGAPLRDASRGSKQLKQKRNSSSVPKSEKVVTPYLSMIGYPILITKRVCF